MSQKLQLGSVLPPRTWNARLRTAFSWHNAALLVLSAAFTGLGFFQKEVWLWVAYLPLLAALVVSKPSRKVALVLGHFSVTVGIASWGLFALGYNPVLIALGALFALMLLGGLTAWRGVGVVSLILLLVLWFPGNPLIMAGALFPSTGIWGIALLAALALWLEWLREAHHKALLLAFGFLLPSLFLWDMQGSPFGRWAGLAPSADLTYPLEGYEDFEASRLLSNAPLRQIQMALLGLPAGSTLITGENTLKDPTAQTLESLCRIVGTSQSTAFVGLEADDGRAEVWRFSAEDCPQPERLYRAALGIPGLTGPELPNPLKVILDTGTTLAAPEALGFLTCFEAFSLQRWSALWFSKHTGVAVLSNDHGCNG